MNYKPALIWLVLMVGCGLFFGWTMIRARPPADHNVEPLQLSQKDFANWPPIADFELTDQRGEAFDSASLRGKVWVGSFFFTNCPAICWRLNQALAGLQASLPGDATFVSITCDPENDTPDALDRYAKHFGADPERWVFLTGEMDALGNVAKQFHVSHGKKVHSDRVFAVDRSGQVRGMFSLTEPGQAERLKKLLAELEAEPG
jgi:protein SCO1/2